MYICYNIINKCEVFKLSGMSTVVVLPRLLSSQDGSVNDERI